MKPTEVEKCLITFQDEGSSRNIQIRVTLSTFDDGLPETAPEGARQSVDLEWMPCEESKPFLKVPETGCNCRKCNPDAPEEPLYIFLAKSAHRDITDRTSRTGPIEGLEAFLNSLVNNQEAEEAEGSTLKSKED